MFTTSWTALKALLVLSVVPGPQAGDTCQDPVFYCRIDNGAHAVRLCEQDDQLTYRFQSARGVPEQNFSTARTSAVVQPWNGVDEDALDSISIPHGIWSYRLFALAPRSIDIDAPVLSSASAGMTVHRDGQEVRQFSCDADSVRERVRSLQPAP